MEDAGTKQLPSPAVDNKALNQTKL